jgi:hypothetical protein
MLIFVEKPNFVPPKKALVEQHSVMGGEEQLAFRLYGPCFEEAFQKASGEVSVQASVNFINKEHFLRVWRRKFKKSG